METQKYTMCDLEAHDDYRSYLGGSKESNIWLLWCHSEPVAAMLINISSDVEAML